MSESQVNEADIKKERIGILRDLSLGVVIAMVLIGVLIGLFTLVGMKSGLHWFGLDYYKLP